MNNRFISNCMCSRKATVSMKHRKYVNYSDDYWVRSAEAIDITAVSSISGFILLVSVVNNNNSATVWRCFFALPRSSMTFIHRQCKIDEDRNKVHLYRERLIRGFTQFHSFLFTLCSLSSPPSTLFPVASIKHPETRASCVCVQNQSVNREVRHTRKEHRISPLSKANATATTKIALR